MEDEKTQGCTVFVIHGKLSALYCSLPAGDRRFLIEKRTHLYFFMLRFAVAALADLFFSSFTSCSEIK